MFLCLRLIVEDNLACLDADTVCGGHHSAEEDANTDHDDADILDAVVGLPHDEDAHQHVDEESPGPEDHMQGHWDVIGKSVVVCNIDKKVHNDKNEPGGEWDLG